MHKDGFRPMFGDVMAGIRPDSEVLKDDIAELRKEIAALHRLIAEFHEMMAARR